MAWTGGELLAGDADARFEGVSIDTRSLEPGQLFVAIAGPNHDGHSYLEAAAAAGARGLMVERGRASPESLPNPLAIVSVDDTTRALGALAAGHRSQFDGPLVAITGSNGKTTTKEMCAAILQIGAPTLKNRGNLNNQFGLPLTLLARKAKHRRVVVELGMNHRGEIAELARIARPGVGVVTNVGSAHVEFLGSREAIAEEKGDLLAALPPDGVAVVNADDDWADALAARSPARVVRFGLSNRAEVRAADVRAQDGSVAFTLEAPEGRTGVEVAGLGDTAVINALCAAAAALAADAELMEVREGLATFRPVGGRLERRELPGGIVLIDDSYNANPQSMEVALRLLAGCGGGRRLAVLGDMGELGGEADKAHRETGRLAASLGIDLLVAVGERAELVAAGAREAGMSAERISVAGSSDEAGAPVRELARRGDCVLVKGSRAMQMERVSRHLEAEARS
jgi:UDP-N-acetylmuramoyl-tripeptide--D-alanyl-D-alanine ligase